MKIYFGFAEDDNSTAVTPKQKVANYVCLKGICHKDYLKIARMRKVPGDSMFFSESTLCDCENKCK